MSHICLLPPLKWSKETPPKEPIYSDTVKHTYYYSQVNAYNRKLRDYKKALAAYKERMILVENPEEIVQILIYELGKSSGLLLIDESDLEKGKVYSIDCEAVIRYEVSIGFPENTASRKVVTLSPKRDEELCYFIENKLTKKWFVMRVSGPFIHSNLYGQLSKDIEPEEFWSNEPDKAWKFKTKQEAEEFLNKPATSRRWFEPLTDFEVTEHIFMKTPKRDEQKPERKITLADLTEGALECLNKDHPKRTKDSKSALYPDPSPVVEQDKGEEPTELQLLQAQFEFMRKDIIKYHGWENEPEIPPINPVVELRIMIKKLQAPKQEEPASQEELRKAFEAGRDYERGISAEYHGGHDNDAPDFKEWLTRKS